MGLNSVGFKDAVSIWTVGAVMGFGVAAFLFSKKDGDIAQSNYVGWPATSTFTTGGESSPIGGRPLYTTNIAYDNVWNGVKMFPYGLARPADGRSGDLTQWNAMSPPIQALHREGDIWG